MGDNVNGLVEFLRARLDEDEAAAKAWLPFGNPDTAQREHIARHDPARVFREVEAQRQFLDFAVRTRDLAERQPTEGQARELRAKWAAYLTALKFGALRYADHPDYREEWRP
jgi:hypothetical protein